METESKRGYREIAAELRALILGGEYAPAALLPRQTALAEQYGVTVMTIKRAVAVLAGEGLVTTVQGRGTEVRRRPPMRRLGADRYARRRWKNGEPAFAADRVASSETWRRDDQTQTVRRVPADDRVAGLYRITPGTEVFERARLVVDERRTPTHTLTSYYRVEDVEGTALIDDTPGPAGPGGGFAVLAEQGLEPDRIRETVHTRMPTPTERERLDLPGGEPVSVLERLTFTRADRLVEVAFGVYAGSRFAWTFDFAVPD